MHACIHSFRKQVLEVLSHLWLARHRVLVL